MKKYALAVFTLIAMSGLAPQQASATTAGFKPGEIMSDAVMTNHNSMSAGEIQAFLNSKVTNCDTNGQQNSEFGGPDLNGDGRVQRWEWGQSRYGQSTFPCLKDYSEGGKSSAQILYDVGKKYSINPQSLVVLLQKEQGLVTDTWPLNLQYRSATGYGCPDTAPCDSQYYGLTNQLDWAAKMFRSIINQSPGWYSPYFKGSNPRVYWHPDTARCGSAPLEIANWTTAALYSYTPYRPNQAALNAGYGMGDSCSSYGNRNFYSYFTDWFGTAYAPLFNTAYVSQSPLAPLKPGESTTVSISFLNNGGGVWFDDSSYPTAPGSPYRYPVRLATNGPTNRASRFSQDWPSNNRAATLFSAVYESNGTTPAGNPHTVTPGQIGRFTFPITIPKGTPAGTYREYFRIIADGTPDGAFNDIGAYFDVVVSEDPALEWVSQTHHFSTVASGSTRFRLDLRNTGNVNLYDDTGVATQSSQSKPVRLATACPINKSSSFSGDWPTVNRPATNFSKVLNSNGNPTNNSHMAKPGEIIRFEFNIKVPDGFTAGTYRECFQPILEGTSDGHFENLGVYSDVTVTSEPTVRITSSPSRLDITAREEDNRTITIFNSGNKSIPTGSKLRIESSFDLKHPSWTDDTTAYSFNGELAPGASITIPFKLLAPYVSSRESSTVKLSLVDSSNQLVVNSVLNLDVSIWPELYVAGFKGQSIYPSLQAGDIDNSYLLYKNEGNKPWYDDTSLSRATSRDPKPVHLATMQPVNRGSGFAHNWSTDNRPALVFSAVYEADGSTLAADQHVVMPRQIVRFNFQQKPAGWVQKSTYREYFQPVLEGTPDGAFNFVGTYLDVTVR